ncbi:unnamed protein product [Cylindrotheca closterium]|uniref:PQ-loop repeat-containing protein n=1 Tax=Cylindrotheca closterium TaxID=2856 RepID=A0AAD2FUV8_9STRA|nr:unnamed protein product [Cylindrotheca closterium]
MSAVDVNQIMTIIGTIGGFSISLSLVPQVYLTYKTKCADDISYTYQFIYIFGAALVNAYAIHFQLYAVYIPCLLELCMIIILTIMKCVYPSREDIKEISRQSMAISRGTQSGVDMKSLSMVMQKMKSIRELHWSDDEEDNGDDDRRSTLKTKKTSKSVRGSFAPGQDEKAFQRQSKLMERKSIAMMKQMSVRGEFDMSHVAGNDKTKIEAESDELEHDA